MVFSALQSIPKGLRISGTSTRNLNHLSFINKETNEGVVLVPSGGKTDVFASPNGEDYYRLSTEPIEITDMPSSFGVLRHGLPQYNFYRLFDQPDEYLLAGIHGGELHRFEKIPPNRRQGNTNRSKAFYEYPSYLIPQVQYKLPDGRILAVAAEREYQYPVIFVGNAGRMEQKLIVNELEDGRLEVKSLGLLELIDNKYGPIRFTPEGIADVIELAPTVFDYEDAVRMGIYLGILDPTHSRSPNLTQSLRPYSHLLTCNDIIEVNDEIGKQVPGVQFAVLPQYLQGAAIMIGESGIGVVTNLSKIIAHNGMVYFSTNDMLTGGNLSYKMDGVGNVQQIDGIQD